MIISRAPVRISMGGGGTDLPSYYQKFGGFLLAASINRYVHILLNKRFEESIRLSYSETEIVDKISEIKHSIFKASLQYSGIKKQIELVSIADVPSNCGLGTSSTFTVSLLSALFSYKREYKSLHELAECACKIEIDILKEPIGKQDQYAAVFGGFNGYTFHRDGKVTVEPVKISDGSLMELQNNMFLFFLNKKRSASDILKVQNKKTKDNNDDVINRLHKIKDIGLHTKKILEQNKINEFGEILHEHWLIKKGISKKISDPFIDEVYECAIKNGALGGKVIGAGGGGFLMFYCPYEKSKLLSSMKKMGLEPTWFSFEREGVKTGFYN
ncbi:MAG: sugar kinase [Ignavibacteriae bacterium]|nr:sugar kinase [Ignavibacteriota bacterium]